MKNQIRRVLLCTAVIVFGSSLYAQEVPLSAQVHQRTDVIVNGKVVESLAADETFYRDSDGSTLSLPAEGHGSNGTLWDNKSGTAYRLNRENLTAYENPDSPHRPNPKGYPPAAKWPDDAVEGIPCKVVPVNVISAPGTPYAKSTTPGSACVSGEFDLELKSDFTIETGPGTTQHHVKELHNIKVNAGLDPALFDVHKYTIHSARN
ncbi:MAG TPA: hypothetical protein VMH04_09625 [Candidatus Solibacter sp.]|nr:hypothetical protein [Candidatus Solibacter sp.]